MDNFAKNLGRILTVQLWRLKHILSIWLWLVFFPKLVNIIRIYIVNFYTYIHFSFYLHNITYFMDQVTLYPNTQIFQTL